MADSRYHRFRSFDGRTKAVSLYLVAFVGRSVRVRSSRSFVTVISEDQKLKTLSNKSAPTSLKVLCAVVIILLLACVGFLANAVWTNFWWKQQVYGLARYQGATRALHDFQSGRLRLFVVAGERDTDKFSGTNEGPFDIRFPQYYQKSFPMRYSVEQMVDMYNEKMRYMRERPDKFLSTTNSPKK